MTHTLIYDVESQIDDADTALYELRNGSLEDALGNIEGIDTALDAIRSELNYVSSELEDLGEFKEEYERHFDDDPLDVYTELEELRKKAATRARLPSCAPRSSVRVR